MLGGRGTGDALTWMTRIVRFITVSASTLFAIACSFLTTFWTPFGRYRWLGMPFGITSAPEEFQRRVDECLEGLENIAVIHDDMITFGSGDSIKEATVS